MDVPTVVVGVFAKSESIEMGEVGALSDLTASRAAPEPSAAPVL